MDDFNFDSDSSNYKHEDSPKLRSFIVRCDLCASKQKVKIDPESEKIYCKVCENTAYFEIVNSIS